MTWSPLHGRLDFVSRLRGTGTPIERVGLLAPRGRRVEAQIDTLRSKLDAIRHKIEYYEGVLTLRDGSPPGTGGRADADADEGRRP